VLFPASTLGRKGCYELREVARSLGISVVLGGSDLECENFWQGVQTERAKQTDLFSGADAIVLPAFVENKPRRLLDAVSCRLPVIASTACGLENVNGVTSIPVGDVAALKSALETCVRIPFDSRRG
jgi:glycosyltransferase involved in cell wall biosynthesis